jgi:hypothetical protein
MRLSHYILDLIRIEDENNKNSENEATKVYDINCFGEYIYKEKKKKKEEGRHALGRKERQG